MILQSLAGLPAFLAYFCTALVAVLDPIAREAARRQAAGTAAPVVGGRADPCSAATKPPAVRHRLTSRMPVRAT
jgi:hypothetical protein